MHQDLMPSLLDKADQGTDGKDSHIGEPWEAEVDVVTTLKSMKHKVVEVGVKSDLGIIKTAIESHRPKIIFNLLEEFNGEAIYDQNVVSYLELLGVSYTGCGPRGLMLSRDKGLSKKILSYHKIRVPKFQVFDKRSQSTKLKLKNYPLIVKCLNEEASLGISTASKVHSEEKVYERVQYLHSTYKTDAIVEEFIAGSEFYVGVIGNRRVETFPVWQLFFDEVESPNQEIYSENAKYNDEYRKRKGIRTGPAVVDEELQKKIQEVAKKTYRALGLNGYARIDLRVDKSGLIYVLEANPNPDISKSDDFAKSASKAQISYANLINKIIRLGL